MNKRQQLYGEDNEGYRAPNSQMQMFVQAVSIIVAFITVFGFFIKIVFF